MIGLISYDDIVEPLFLDTNVLIRATLDTAPLHEEAPHVLEHHDKAGAESWISRQVLREYVAQRLDLQTLCPIGIITVWSVIIPIGVP